MNTEKKLSDYLHFYLGCDVRLGQRDGKLLSIGCDGEPSIVQSQNDDEESGFYGETEDIQVEENMLHMIKPILRRLSDKTMTEDERKEWHTRRQRKGWMPGIHADNTLWLISKGFWLFGDSWFTEGLIIDADTIK